MGQSNLIYLVFGIVLLAAVLLDLGLLSKKGHAVPVRSALWQTALWVGLALAFFAFLLVERGQVTAWEYLSAYLMEWSLSVDNIFVFILIFDSFRIKPIFYGRVLMVGILAAILLRVGFITVGVGLVARWHWVLYIFGVILIYTGVSMFRQKKGNEEDVHEGRPYKLLKRVLPLTDHDGGGKWRITEGGRKKYTTLFVVVLLLAMTDIVFALDSIPAVFGITQEKLVIYTSNIFAVLGLRSLFFLLQGAAARFSRLQQGIAVVLLFVGIKMLAEIWEIHLPAYISLLVILLCLGGAMLLSARRPPTA
ncbi:MAG: TerC/Alx family metal homeostasis membrane protein [Bacteroidota bacterium]|nr:TerC/Alx family metal homeostasis membrane protein [Bacteroidota bacterium]MDP4218287.1 TerC/Alx family metal homeostasis membrane protein [Bacteroidota bacterium]MDP4255740.1 TerC/Alx family metal homeostasis membrane protein [Bacteroidota bacterium]MDP4259967.1 TerC/Alx family metal homeostasis membrane protein [Bacteroidota bacterium]